MPAITPSASVNIALIVYVSRKGLGARCLMSRYADDASPSVPSTANTARNRRYVAARVRISGHPSSARWVGAPIAWSGAPLVWTVRRLDVEAQPGRSNTIDLGAALLAGRRAREAGTTAAPAVATKGA